ncbi:hypothetical protein AGDE_16636 [Angomonas deanei]|uniref:Uncharacterized protein n=1 Tax=Angomonas deanei TaxID=59799 RepID=A0A7G2C2X8_9TRYP|nr:hypothetical protein AGDE_16636 [Angomonas deanei]CAD2213604.1 hypothetical protein, conserved [Angomonas deanei]|eukprot:EPY16734.1 hypothetical protein AGDE_16636 [Angomonas deanei]
MGSSASINAARSGNSTDASFGSINEEVRSKARNSKKKTKTSTIGDLAASNESPLFLEPNLPPMGSRPNRVFIPITDTFTALPAFSPHDSPVQRRGTTSSWYVRLDRTSTSSGLTEMGSSVSQHRISSAENGNRPNLPTILPTRTTSIVPSDPQRRQSHSASPPHAVVQATKRREEAGHTSTPLANTSTGILMNSANSSRRSSAQIADNVNEASLSPRPSPLMLNGNNIIPEKKKTVVFVQERE